MIPVAINSFKLTLAYRTTVPDTISPGSMAIDWKPTDGHHNWALVETWIGRTAVNIGELSGGALYDFVWQALDAQCPYDPMRLCMFDYKIPVEKYSRKVQRVHEIHLKYGIPIDTQDSYTWVRILSGRYSDDQTRRLLIGAVASAVGPSSFFHDRSADPE